MTDDYVRHTPPDPETRTLGQIAQRAYMDAPGGLMPRERWDIVAQAVLDEVARRGADEPDERPKASEWPSPGQAARDAYVRRMGIIQALEWSQLAQAERDGWEAAAHGAVDNERAVRRLMAAVDELPPEGSLVTWPEPDARRPVDVDRAALYGEALTLVLATIERAARIGWSDDPTAEETEEIDSARDYPTAEQLQDRALTVARFLAGDPS